MAGISKLREQTTQGVFWTSVSAASVQAFRFVVVAILARLLFPKDFGLVGMAIIFIGLIAMLNEVGIGSALVQRKDVTEKHRSTMFWAGIGLGLVSWITVIFASPYVAIFFGKDLIRPIMVVLAFTFVISSFGKVHKSLLHKELNFQRLAYTEIGAAIFNGCISIILALSGFEVWSLVVGQLSHNLIEVILLWKVHPWRPQFMFSVQSFKELFGFGVNIWAFAFVDYGRSNVDYFFIGKLLNSTALGLYTLAYNISDLGRSKLSMVIIKVAFPAFSKVQDDNERLRRGYLKTVSYVSLIVFPLMAGLIIVAPEFVKVVYGTKWTPMILPLQILCVVGMLYSIGATVGCIFLAKGRPEIQLKLGIVWLILLTGFVIFGTRYGIVGVAMAVFFYAFIAASINQLAANRLIDLRMSDFLHALYPSALGSLTMVLVLILYRYFQYYLLGLSNAILLLSSVLLGAFSYIVTLNMMKVKAFYEVWDILKDQVEPYVRLAIKKISTVTSS